VPCFQGQIKVIMTDVVVAPYPELLSVQFCTDAENFMLLSPSEQFLLFSQLSSCTIKYILWGLVTLTFDLVGPENCKAGYTFVVGNPLSNRPILNLLQPFVHEHELRSRRDGQTEEGVQRISLHD